MPTTAAALVVDTSVLVKWFKTDHEDLVAEARALLERVERIRAEVYAPSLLFYEVGNILARKSDLDDAAVAAVLSGIAASRLIVAPPEPGLLARAARIARAHDLSFYDASFVALAVALGCPLVTADRTLAGRTRDLGIVRHLSDAANLP
jgi:predicted nucleic acid-binding protein